MRRWGKRTADESVGAVLFFALAGAAVFSLSCYMRLRAGAALYGKVKSDYLLMTLQCTLGLIGMKAPLLLDRRWHLQLPWYIFLMFYAFLFCAVFLGEVLSFYDLFAQWDMALHFFSGGMLCLLGFCIADLPAEKSNFSPAQKACFALCFSLALGAVWEIYEYVMYGALGMNMQRFGREGVLLTGRGALRDTMEDLMADAAAALITAGCGYAAMRRKGGAD